MNADPKFDAFLGGNPGVALGHRLLHFNRPPQGINNTGELDE